jgi:hypothetical protein
MEQKVCNSNGPQYVTPTSSKLTTWWANAAFTKSVSHASLQKVPQMCLDNVFLYFMLTLF